MEIQKANGPSLIILFNYCLMQFTDTDFGQTDRVAELVRFCDTADIKTLEQVTDEIYRHQPFLISLFMGYKDDVDMLQLDEVLRVLIIIWLFFKEHENVKSSKITVNTFEARQMKNVRFLKYLDGEPSKQDQDNIIDANLGALESKALFTAVLFKFKEGPALKKLHPEPSGIMLLGMKSLIECFEDISKSKKKRSFFRR